MVEWGNKMKDKSSFMLGILDTGLLIKRDIIVIRIFEEVTFKKSLFLTGQTKATYSNI